MKRIEFSAPSPFEEDFAGEKNPPRIDPASSWPKENDFDMFSAPSCYAPPPKTKRKKHFPVVAVLIFLGFAAGIAFLLFPESDRYEAQKSSPSVQIETGPQADSLGQAYAAKEIECYYESTLSGEDKTVYGFLLQGIAERRDKIEFKCSRKPDNVLDIYELVLDDHPEYFWADYAAHMSWVESGGEYEVSLTPEYFLSAARIPEAQAEIESITSGILETLAGEDEYGKALGVYTYVIEHTKYDLSYSGKSMYELFIRGRAVCQGYAAAVQYLLKKLDVECLFVTGEAADNGSWDGHAWNMVRIDNEYYVLDATWGDPVSDSGEQSLSYDYFCVTSEDVGKTHQADRNDLPVCTSTKANYYYHEDLVLTTFDTGVLRKWIENALNMKEDLVFRAGDRSVYKSVKSYLDDSEELFNLIPDEFSVGSISFEYNDNMYTFRISY